MLRGATLVVKKICSRGMPDARIASAQGCSLRYARAESTWRYPVRKAWRVTDSVISAGLSRLIQACTDKAQHRNAAVSRIRKLRMADAVLELTFDRPAFTVHSVS